MFRDKSYITYSARMSLLYGQKCCVGACFALLFFVWPCCASFLDTHFKHNHLKLQMKGRGKSFRRLLSSLLGMIPALFLVSIVWTLLDFWSLLLFLSCQTLLQNLDSIYCALLYVQCTVHIYLSSLKNTGFKNSQFRRKFGYFCNLVMGDLSD